MIYVYTFINIHFKYDIKKKWMLGLPTTTTTTTTLRTSVSMLAHIHSRYSFITMRRVLHRCRETAEAL